MIPLPQLDEHAVVPLYRQLYEHLKDLIRSGRLEGGAKLPATRELAGLLGLNRATVSAAYELLEHDGLLSGHVGRGSFVTGAASPAAEACDWSALLRPGDAARMAPVLPPVALSFASARPSEQLFPLEDLRASGAEVMAGPEFSTVLQLGSPAGYEPLRQHLWEGARQQQAARPADDLMVTSGCQQALDLLGRVLLSPGDAVILEDPVYPGLKNLFAAAGARLVGVPVGADGIEIEALERVLEREKARLLVVTPNFQNPTGATLPLASRQALLRAARQAGVVVVENDIYGELRYRGEPLPGLKQLDEAGAVVLLRSFSKITFPGLRVGWIIAPKPLIARLAQAKQLADLHTDQLSQAVLLRFAESGRLDRHKQRMLAAGSERLAAVLAGCERFLPPGARFTRPQGGMNLWVRLPEPLDAGELLGRALRAEVAYVPGIYFGVSRFDAGALRLTFAGLAPEEIRKGLALLGEIFAGEWESARRAGHHLESAPALV